MSTCTPVGRFRHFSKSGTGNDDELGTGNLNAGNAGHQICLKFVPVIAVPVITGGRPALPVTGNTSGNWQPPSPAQRSKNPKMFSSPKPSLCFRREIQKVCFRQQRFFTGRKNVGGRTDIYVRDPHVTLGSSLKKTSLPWVMTPERSRQPVKREGQRRQCRPSRFEICLKFVPVIAVPVITGGRPHCR